MSSPSLLLSSLFGSLSPPPSSSSRFNPSTTSSRKPSLTPQALRMSLCPFPSWNCVSCLESPYLITGGSQSGPLLSISFSSRMYTPRFPFAVSWVPAIQWVFNSTQWDNCLSFCFILAPRAPAGGSSASLSSCSHSLCPQLLGVLSGPQFSAC